MKTIRKNKLSIPENAGVIKYLDRLARGSGMVHPDITYRMKELYDGLNGMALCRYENSIIIMCNQTLAILAVAFGMAYSLRTGAMFDKAINAGAETTHQWSDGSSPLNLMTFGNDWIAGMWHKDEAVWISSVTV